MNYISFPERDIPKRPAANARLITAPPVPGERVETVTTLRGATVKILISFPENGPIAAILLFVGDHGNLGLMSDGGMAWGESNLLMRTRGLFRRHGFVVAMVDAPSDRNGRDGLYGFRASQEHADDISAVAAFVRARAGVPVWAIGTSRGAESSTNVAARRPDGCVAGIGLVAAVTTPKSDPPSMPGCIFDSPLSRINVPVLVVHHIDDACPYSPCDDVPRVRAALVSAPSIDVMIYAGGLPPEGDPCRPYHAHGFFGIEEAVVADIVGRVVHHMEPL